MKAQNITPTASFLDTLFNGLNALSGIGIITIPYTVAAGGWLSLVLLLIIASSTFFTGLLLKRCMDIDPSVCSYPDIGDKAFGKTGRTVVLLIMNIELYLVATALLIMEGDNLSNLFPQVTFDIPGTKISSKKSFIIMVAAIMLPTTWLNNMKILSYISATGAVTSFIILGSILWVGKFDGVGFHEKGQIINWSGMPTAGCFYAFCFGGHAVFPTLYASMKNKDQFSKVMLLCFVISTMTYSLMGVVGYRMYGEKAESQITLNLPTNRTSSKVAIFTILVSPIVKYALFMKPIVDTIEERFPSFKTRKFSIFMRTKLVVSTVVVAIAFPFFGYLMSIVGALLNVTASIILPSLFYVKISGNYKVFGLELVIIGFIVFIGILIATFGTYTSIADVARKRTVS